MQFSPKPSSLLLLEFRCGSLSIQQKRLLYYPISCYAQQIVQDLLKRMRLAVIANLVTEVINKIYPIILIQIVHERIGMDKFGFAQFGITLVELSVPFIIFGYDVYSAILFNKETSIKSRGELIASNLLLRLANSALIFLGVLLWLSQTSLDNHTKSLVFILCFTLFTNALDSSWVLNGLQKTTLLSLFIFFSKLSTFTIILFSVHASDDAILYAVLSSSTGALVNIATLVYALKRFPARLPSRQTLARLFRTSIPFAIIAILTIIFQRMDMVAARLWVNDYELGLFAGPFRLNHALYTLMGSIANVFFSEQTGAASKRDTSLIYESALFTLAFLTVPMVVGVWLVDSKLLDFALGAQFASQGRLFSLMVLTNLATVAIPIYANQLLIPHHRTTSVICNLAAGILLFAILALPLGNIAGLGGIVIAGFIGKILAAVLCVHQAKAYVDKLALDKAWRHVAPALCSVGIVYVSGLEGLFTQLGLAIGLYPLFSLGFNFAIFRKILALKVDRQ